MSRYSRPPSHFKKSNVLQKPNRPQATDMKELEKGFEIESKEHPSMNKDEVRQIAKDHLREDPHHYMKQNSPKAETTPQHIEREGHDYPIGGKPGDKFDNAR